MSFQSVDEIIKHYAKELDKLKTAEFNQVSHCCHREIIVSSRTEYPLSGRKWGMTYDVDICECCGKDCSPVDQCEVCGVVGCLGGCEE